MTDTDRPAPATRLLVPDVLRGIAIVCMLLAHAKPFLFEPPRVLALAISNLADLASPLFALVMGMSAQLMVRKAGSAPLLLLQQLLRGLFLIALGVWMTTWGSWVAIVLQFLGVTLVLGAPLVLLPSRVLLPLTIVLAAIAEPINVWTNRAAFPTIITNPELFEVANWFVLGTSYRATNLLPFFLLGALLLRHGFRRDRLLLALAIAAPVAYGTRLALEVILSVDEFRSGSLPDTLHDLGIVLAVYVVVVASANVRGERGRAVVAVASDPLTRIGRVALSLYVLHIALLGFWLQPQYAKGTTDLFAFAVIVIGCPLAGILGQRLVGTGPVEWVLGWLSGRRKTWRSARVGYATAPVSGRVPATGARVDGVDR